MSALLAGLVIVMIGDSQMAASNRLIDSLHDDLTKAGATVYSFGVCGSKPSDWLKEIAIHDCSAVRLGDQKPQFFNATQTKTKGIKDLVASYKPNLIIVEQAETISGYDKAELPKPWIVDQVQSLTYEIDSQKTACVWLGPTWGEEGGSFKKTFAGVKRLDDFLQTIVSPCDYVSSLGFAKPGEWKTTDGLHFIPQGFKSWADNLTTAIAATPTVKKLTAK